MDAHLTFKATGMVMAGGALGAALRFHATVMTTRLGHIGYPYATLAVNVIGGFAMGIVAALVLRGFISEPWRLFVAVGILGGFTTFSAFSLELFQMIERGNWTAAVGYALLSVMLSLFVLAAGFAATRALT